MKSKQSKIGHKRFANYDGEINTKVFVLIATVLEKNSSRYLLLVEHAETFATI